MPEHIILKINSFYCKKLYSSAQIIEDRRFFCDGPSVSSWETGLEPRPVKIASNHSILEPYITLENKYQYWEMAMRSCARLLHFQLVSPGDTISLADSSPSLWLDSLQFMQLYSNHMQVSFVCICQGSEAVIYQWNTAIQEDIGKGHLRMKKSDFLSIEVSCCAEQGFFSLLCKECSF